MTDSLFARAKLAMEDSISLRQDRRALQDDLNASLVELRRAVSASLQARRAPQHGAADESSGEALEARSSFAELR